MTYFWISNLVFFAVVYISTYGQKLEINMPESIEGEVGNTLLNMTCNYTIQDFKKIASIEISREDTTSGSRIKLVSFRPDSLPDFIQGSYLINRTIIKGFSEASPAPTITFTILECSDDGIYYCTIRYFNPDLVSKTANTTLVIKEPPSKPDRITYIKKDEQDIETTTMLYNETVTNGHVSSSSPGINYSNNNNTDKNQTFSEGDRIILFCEGSTGFPLSNLTLQKQVLPNDRPQDIIVTERYTTVDQENCSSYQNVTAIISLSAQDNQAIFTCAVGDWNESTEPINVKYPVRKPNVTQGEHGGINPAIILSCSSDGNPAPVYSWFRATNTSQPNQWESYKVTRNITFKITEEGIYRCDVKNSFAGKTYNESTTFNYTFTAPQTTFSTTFITTERAYTTVSTLVNAIPEKTTPFMSTPGGPEKNKIEDRNRIYYVVGGVGGGAIILIIVVVVIVKCSGNRKPKKSHQVDESGGSLVHQPSRKQSVDANNYYSVSLDDDGAGRGFNTEQVFSTQEETRKHNEKYLKEQNAVNANPKDRGEHIPVEYAMVNKPSKGQSRKQQNDRHQPTEYAQVKKVQKTISIEPQQDEDQYASGQGIYDHANDRRHNQPTASDQYDTPGNINKKRSDKVGTVVEITGESTKQKQVAKVKPSGRFGYENASMIQDDVIKNKELNTEL